MTARAGGGVGAARPARVFFPLTSEKSVSYHGGEGGNLWKECLRIDGSWGGGVKLFLKTSFPTWIRATSAWSEDKPSGHQSCRQARPWSSSGPTPSGARQGCPRRTWCGLLWLG